VEGRVVPFFSCGSTGTWAGCRILDIGFRRQAPWGAEYSNGLENLEGISTVARMNQGDGGTWLVMLVVYHRHKRELELLARR
jgi:hypothetical protein